MISINRKYENEGLKEHDSKFEAGEIVRHVRYGYRGVIVDVDVHCRADPAWYMSNQTQPSRNQPWYHVLVDQSHTVTYPAEENLILDTSGLPVDHPLVGFFFTEMRNGRYLRNQEPWPRADE